MADLTLHVPDESLEALRLSPRAASKELLLVAATKLYELRRLSSGAAAQLAGVPRTVFLSKLGDYGIPTFDLSEDELQEELARS